MAAEAEFDTGIGFAALWSREPRTTWSGTPWRLRESLARRCELVDVSVTLSPALRTLLKLGHVRFSPSTGITSSWDYSRALDAIVRRRILRRATGAELHAVLQIQDLAVLPWPYHTYQDMSFGALRRLTAAGTELTHYPALSDRNLELREQRQRRVYDAAAGVMTMSGWLADQLALDGIAPDKIHVVHPGINSPVAARASTAQSEGPPRGPFRRASSPRTVLFLGRDFTSKGGDLVVRALPMVRRRFRSDTELVVAGPKDWPMVGPPPEGVRFLGAVSQVEAADLLASSDLLVMPSRFEGFGIVLAEALVAGLPCIARRAFAMPEIIQDGVNGRLVTDDDASTLADVISATLDDPSLYEQTWEGRADAAAYWTWDRAAEEILAVMELPHGETR
jgi:glycosyltransferase involved in cell wall biosynthesis